MSEPGYRKSLVVDFVDPRTGEMKKIHQTRHGLKIAREATQIDLLSGVVGPLVGSRIRAARLRSGLSLSQLCHRAGLRSVTPKQRMYELEKGSRKHAPRLATLYALAFALDVSISDLLPSVEDIASATGMRLKSESSLTIENETR